MIIVRHLSVTVVNAFRHMHASVHCKIVSVLSANAVCGIMVVECSNAHFVTDFYAKMISSNIKQNVKSLILKIINVDHAIN